MPAILILRELLHFARQAFLHNRQAEWLKSQTLCLIYLYVAKLLYQSQSKNDEL